MNKLPFTPFRILIFTFLISLFTNCQPKDVTWERIVEAGVLHVGMDPTYPPFEVADGDDLRGLDVDLIQAIAADLGLEAEFTFFGYDSLYDALATGRVDVLASALVIVPERTRNFAYSDSYFNAGEILIVLAEAENIEEMADLNGRILAVELGAPGHVEATIWAKRLPDLTVQPYDTADEALTAVAHTQAHAALVDSISGRLYLTHEPRLKRIPQPVTVEPFAFVVRTGDNLLLKKLNDSLETLRQSGQLDQITNHWLGN